MAKEQTPTIHVPANIKVPKQLWARFGQYCDRNNYQKLGKGAQIFEDALEAEMRRDDA